MKAAILGFFYFFFVFDDFSYKGIYCFSRNECIFFNPVLLLAGEFTLLCPPFLHVKDKRCINEVRVVFWLSLLFMKSVTNIRASSIPTFPPFWPRSSQ